MDCGLSLQGLEGRSIQGRAKSERGGSSEICAFRRKDRSRHVLPQAIMNLEHPERQCPPRIAQSNTDLSFSIPNRQTGPVGKLPMLDLQRGWLDIVIKGHRT